MELTIAALKIVAQAMWDAHDERTHARQGFRDGLLEPGRSHGLDTQHNAAGRPIGTVACYAHGWAAAQEVLRLLRNAQPAPAHKTKKVRGQDPVRGSGRPHRRRPDS